MNNTETLRERIEQIINKENLTYTQFARRIGIQGTIVSHIMNGRNKPSLDVIMKILENFKNINAEWLLFGNGETYKNYVQYSENKDITTKNNDSQLSLNSILFTETDNQSEYTKENELKNDLEKTIEKDESNIEHSDKLKKVQSSTEEKIDSNTDSEFASNNINETKTKEEKPIIVNPPKHIKKIVIFYSDQSYEEFKSDLS
jgi:transcriptional regulator with XRE-family HTH domain